MSEYAKRYKPRPGFMNGDPRLFEANGRRIIKYNYKEKSFANYSATKVLKDIDETEIESFLRSTFFEMLSDDELKKKCKKIKNVMWVEAGNFYTIDCQHFFKNPYSGLFPFNNSDELKCSELLAYFKNRGIKVINMPVTKYSGRYKNYVAFIDMNNYTVLSLLSYLVFKPTDRFSDKSFGFYSAQSYKTFVEDKENMIECIYSILSKSVYPRDDWHVEVMVRCSSTEGWPKPYELKTEYATFKLFAANAGLVKYQNPSEAELYNLVSKKYPDALYQYYDDWLDNLSLDIYIPSLRVGIEFQGDQHIKPVKFFGGKEGFQRRVENDTKKKKLCKENNVTLIEWPYSLEINKSNLQKLLNTSETLD